MAQVLAIPPKKSLLLGGEVTVVQAFLIIG